MAADDEGVGGGLRKDGQPYAPNNVRSDGSFNVGKGRPAVSTQFKKNDGRPRGRRAKGIKNLSTVWDKALGERIVISVNGVKKKYTKTEALVLATVDRALKGSDRATDIALRHAASIEKQPDKMRASDHDIILLYLSAYLGQVPGSVSDDHDDPSAIAANPEGDDG